MLQKIILIKKTFLTKFKFLSVWPVCLPVSEDKVMYNPVSYRKCLKS